MRLLCMCLSVRILKRGEDGLFTAHWHLQMSDQREYILWMREDVFRFLYQPFLYSSTTTRSHKKSSRISLAS